MKEMWLKYEEVRIESTNRNKEEIEEKKNEEAKLFVIIEIK